MATGPLVILDDILNNFQHYDAAWKTSRSPYFYGGSALVLDSNDPTTSMGNVTLSIYFEGVNIALYGTSPSPLGLETISVSIDNGPSISTAFSGQTSSSYRQLYRSPILTDGRHNAVVGLSAGASLDFAAVTPTAHTPLKGQTLVVDDDYNGIDYVGGWRRNVKDVISNIHPGSPFHNGTHQTWNAGDSLSFTFIGTSVAVYGIFDWAHLGSLSATFTLDGSPKSDLYTVDARSPEFVDAVGQILNFPFFSSGVIAGGKHTLLVNITQCVNQTFILDYITYSPSFDTILQVPNHTTVSTPTLEIYPIHTDGYAGPLGTSAGAHNKSAHSSPNAIIGGCIGALLLITLGGAVLICLLRKRATVNLGRNRQRDVFDDPSRPLMQNSLPRNIPLRPPSSLSHRSVSPYPYFTPITPCRPSAADKLKRSAQEQRRSIQMSNPPQPISTNVVVTNSHSSNTASAEVPSFPRHIPDSSGFSFQRPTVDFDNSSPQRALGIITQSPLFCNTSPNPMTAPYPERQAWSATDSSSNPVHLPSRFPSRQLTGAHRDVPESQLSIGVPSTFQPVLDNYSYNRPEESSFSIQRTGQVQNKVPIVSTSMHIDRPNTRPAVAIHVTRDTHPTTTIPSHHNQRSHSAAILLPLRRRVQSEDPIISASQPVHTTTSLRLSPIAAAFPRLSAVFLRHKTSTNVPEEVGNDTESNWDGQYLAPPAYSPNPRRTRDANISQSNGWRPLPVPGPQPNPVT